MWLGTILPVSVDVVLERAQILVIDRGGVIGREAAEFLAAYKT
jgi:hypothetical protein